MMSTERPAKPTAESLDIMKKIKVLLCLPHLTDYLPVIQMFPPAGAAYVSASIKKAGYEVFSLNANLLEGYSLYEKMAELIAVHNISLIGVGGTVTDYHGIKQIADTAKQIKPEITVFLGGGFVTFSPSEAMRLIPNADYGVIGEGEITACDLLGALASGKDVLSVHGLVVRSTNEFGGEILNFTPPRIELPDIDTVPWPDYEGFRLFDAIPDSAYGAVTTSRSCPYRCTFCSHSGGNTYRQRSLDSIFAEIEYLVNRYKIRKLSLSDELFSVRSDRLLAFCERIKSYDIEWRAFIRIDRSLTLPILKIMKDAGCNVIYYGAESADDRILKSMNKGITVQEIERVLTLTKEAGIQSMVGFIFGDPQETMETVRNTIDWIFGHRHLMSMAVLEPIVLYPGSQIYYDAVKRGIISDPAEFIRQGCPLTNISKLSDNEYKRLVNEILPEANRKLREYDLLLYKQTGKKHWLA